MDSLTSAEFRTVYAFRKRRQSESFIYYWKPAECFRLGIVITRKDGNSVKRHRIRRQIKEIVRQFAGDYKFMIIIKIKKTQTSFWDMKDEIDANVKRINQNAQHYKVV